jgi:cytochrome b subunit of formate dehydrogenase
MDMGAAMGPERALNAAAPHSFGPDVPLDTAQRGRGPYIWRFNLFHRLTHATAMLSFYVLVLTGIPLRFTCAPFSEPLIRFWGGVERAGLIHRYMAVVMVTYTLVHIVWVAVRFFRSTEKRKWLWGSDTMIPHPQDALDFLNQWRWYFGRGPKPQFGRYSYLDKMDYFGEVWGFIIIAGSGFLLWFPEFFGRWLPGWLFNVATVFHGYEALIAAAFLFSIHFFNVHLRPDKFPLDAVMWHGRGTLDYMKEEHPLMEAELEAAVRQPVSERPVADLPAPPPTRTSTVLGAFFGFLAWGSGVAIIGMILWAVLC